MLLSVANLCVEFDTPAGPLRAVDGIALEVHEGRTAVIVGESGSGKSATALALMGLLPRGGRAGGEILFEGRNLLSLDSQGMRRLRGRRMAMIFQEPMTCLNPVLAVGRQIVEAVQLHESLGARAARERAIDMLRRVGIPAPERRFADYPHHLSGGMRQRVMIAMALACRPSLLIADEPTTALDVTTQAQILGLLRGLGADLGMAVLFITHDLGVAAAIADEIYVMYAGRVVERAPASRLFAEPLHPYTQALLRCAPRLGRRGRLEAIPGAPPARAGECIGCRFEPRCGVGRGDPLCRAEEPALEEITGRRVACWKAPGASPGSVATA